MILLLLAIFFGTVFSGPGGKEYLARRKLLKDRAKAKVLAFPYPKNHPRKL